MAGLVDTNAFSTISASILSDETASQAGDLYIRSITFSPDCKYLATGAEDRQIRASTAWLDMNILQLKLISMGSL